MDSGIQEFRKCVLDAYRPLLERGELQVVPGWPKAHGNLFSVRIANEFTTIEVEGINWGSNAWTKVFRNGIDENDRYGLPIRRLLEQRGAIPPLNRNKPDPLDQNEQVYLYAYAIMESARDVLAGDFSALDALKEI